MSDNVVKFPGTASPSRKILTEQDLREIGRKVRANLDRETPREKRRRNGPNMQTLLFRSRELILESDEADLVRDVCLDLDRAERKLKRIRQRLKDLQEWAAAEVQLLTAADTKLSAAIVAARSAERPSSIQAKAEPDLQDIIDGYAQAPAHVQQIVFDMLRVALAKQPPEHPDGEPEPA